MTRALMLVELIQVVIDLFCLGGAGRDGAMKLYWSLTKEVRARRVSKRLEREG
ncbi:MAG: hypothetical protein ACRECH_13075 [Nitrososphaerales archaeon]